MNEHFFIYNGTYYQHEEPVIIAGNRSLRYGDGLFETMRMHNGRIWNLDLHFERLFSGMKTLQFDIPENFSQQFFLGILNELLLKNQHPGNARIRLMVFRGNGNILDYENKSPGYIIETSPLTGNIEWNEKGLVVDIFPDAAKSCDIFSNLKSNNYLPSVMAGLFAKNNNLDDAIILNAYGRICESAIANIFIVKDKNIFTPPLSEGCVAGNTRRWLLENLSHENYKVKEKKLHVDDLLKADELFLTNAIQPVRWIKNFRDKNYGNSIANEVYHWYIKHN